ncbi:MAG: winged helix-turn-helix transcriptional regulator [Haloarculaceae archaeon]
MDEPEFDLESRRELYRAIRHAPGVHVRELERRLDYAKGTVQYHLRWLADHDLVEVHTDGEFSRYYPAHELDDDEKATVSALRRTYSREVIAHLAADGPLTTTDLADRIAKSRSTVSWHLSRLHDAGLVEKRRDGRRVEYALVDRDRVLELYAVYEESFTDRLLDNVLDVWNA